MKFTKEQQDFIKNASQHVYVLTGGRGHSKTKELIENLQQELDQYKNNWEELKEYIKKFPGISYASSEKVDGERLSGKLIPATKVLNKMKELEENK